MGHAHRLSTFQLGILLFASGIIGACCALVTSRSAVTRAEAATLNRPDQTKGEKTKDKKKMACPVTHFEIGCRNSAKTREFYSNLFDWQIHEDGPAVNIKTGSKKGIDGHITSLGHDPQNYVTIYIEVDDIKAYLEKATALGGKTLVPAIKIPTGHFAWISDPDGNIVGLLQPN